MLILIVELDVDGRLLFRGCRVRMVMDGEQDLRRSCLMLRVDLVRIQWTFVTQEGRWMIQEDCRIRESKRMRSGVVCSFGFIVRDSGVWSSFLRDR